MKALATKIWLKKKIPLKECNTPGNKWHNKHLDYIMTKCAFYECFDCKIAFYGGTVDCAEDLNMAETTTKQELKCKACLTKMIGGG